VPSVSLFPRFLPDVRLAAREGSHLTIEIAGAPPLRLKAPTAALADAVAALFDGGRTESELVDAAGGGMESAARLHLYLSQLKARQLIGYEWSAGAARAFVEPLVPSFGFSRPPLARGARVVLSRFAYVHRDADRLVLESPDAPCRIILRTPCLLASVHRLADAASDGGEELDAVAELLWQTGLLEEADRETPPDERTWEFHDRLFHRRSRRGAERRIIGGTYRFDQAFPAPALDKPPMSADRIELPRPDPDALARGEALGSVMERRRSVRDMDDDRAIAAADVGALLFRVARRKERLASPKQELMLRPVPGGGAVHELEFYVAVRLCHGLEPGFYHYQSGEHALYRLPAPQKDLDTLIGDAGAAMAQPDRPPQVLIVLASRLPRLAWKYEGIAYRVTLLNAGVILQSLYLVATEMHLACTAVGSGNSDAFTRAAGVDAFGEVSVAEFALGSRR